MSADAPRPETTLAVLLGAGAWPEYAGLDGGSHFAASSAKFAEYLSHPGGLGLPAENICNLFDDDRSPSDIVNALDDFLHARQQALLANAQRIRDFLFYFVGHAEQHEPTQQYHLILRCTRQRLWYSSSLEIFKLFDTFTTNTPGARRYYILDACYAGVANKFIYQSSPGASIGKQLEVFSDKGTAILSSSGARVCSKAPQGEQYTMFSGALLEVLTPTARQKAKRLSLRDLRELTAEVISKKYGRNAVWPEVSCGYTGYRGVADSPILPVLSSRGGRGKKSRDTEGSSSPVAAEQTGSAPVIPRTTAPAAPKPVVAPKPLEKTATQTAIAGSQSISSNSAATVNKSQTTARPVAEQGKKSDKPAVVTLPRRSYTPVQQGAGGGSLIILLIWLAIANRTQIENYLRGHGWLEKKPAVTGLPGIDSSKSGLFNTSSLTRLNAGTASDPLLWNRPSEGLSDLSLARKLFPKTFAADSGIDPKKSLTTPKISTGPQVHTPPLAPLTLPGSRTLPDWRDYYKRKNVLDSSPLTRAKLFDLKSLNPSPPAAPAPTPFVPTASPTELPPTSPAPAPPPPR